MIFYFSRFELASSEIIFQKFCVVLLVFENFKNFNIHCCLLCQAVCV